MSKEIVLRLAKEKWITRWQIENALERQLIYQGSLVDNLIRLGYLDQERMLHYFSTTFDLPTINPELLRSIPSHVLEMLPRDLVTSYRVLPVGVKNNHLIIATFSPLSKQDHDDLVFFTGMDLKVTLTSENLLVDTIRYYYGILLPSIILDNIGLGDKLFVPEEAPDLEELIDMAGESPEPEKVDLLATPVPEAIHTTPQEELSPPPSSDQDAASAERNILNQTNPKMQEDVQEETIEIDELEDLLDAADTRDEIIMGACGWLRSYYSVTLFLTIKKSSIGGYYGEGSPEVKENVKDLELSLNLDSALKTAVDDNEVQCATFDEDTSVDHIVKFCGMTPPEEALILPIFLKSKAIGLVVALKPNDDTPTVNAEVGEQIRQAISAAFETLILSKKIGI